MDLSTATSKIVDQGVLGALLLISGAGNFFFIRGWLNEKDKRIEDAIKVRDTINAPLSNLQTTLNSMQTLLQSLVNNK